MKLIMNTRAAVAILMATAMIFSSILLEPLQATAAGPTAPGAPSNVMAVGNADSISVSWSAPTGGGAAVVKYEIRWKIRSVLEGPGWSSVNAGTTAGSYLITGLVEWGLYDLEIYSVAAGCPETSGCYSVAATITAVALETDAEWSHEISPSTTVTFKRGPGQAFGPYGYLPENYFIWSDLANARELSFDLEVDSDTTFMDVRLYPLDETTRLLSATGLEINHNFADSAPGVVSDLSFDIDSNVPLDADDLCDVTCPTVFRFEVTTYKDDVGDVIDAVKYFYLVRKQDAKTSVLKYENPSGITAKFSADDPRWMQVVDSTMLLMDPSSLYPDGVRGVELVDPSIFWERLEGQDKYANGKYFGGWCLIPNPHDMEDDCIDPAETSFPVSSDTVLYPLWIDDLEPDSISIGAQPFNQGDWDYDPVQRAIYLTVESPADVPLVGAVSIVGPMIVGPMRVEYDTDSDFSFYVEPLGGSIMQPTSSGSYVFEPLCDDPACAQIYLMDGDISFGGADLSSYKIYLIAARDTTAKFSGLKFDATPGALNAVDPERIDTRENQVIGWYPVPVVPDRSADFINYAGWEDTATDGEGYWEAFFPVLADDMTLSLDWGFGPFVSVLPSVTIFRGDSQVATASASFDSAPSSVLWALIGTDDFQISDSGEISLVDPQLRAAKYTFSIVAGDNANSWVGPPVQMTVFVVERSQVGNSQNTNLPPTNQTGAGQHLPKPGSKLQADLISKVSRSKLGIGGTAQFGVTGGEPGATRVFASNNPRICSINARGLVTAKSTGVCLISATATAQDPIFAPASAPLTKIVVLGSGLINNAKVTVLKGQVSIKASLLKSLAGKSVKLAIEVKRGGKWVLVPMRREVLSKSATATFKSFAKPRPGTRVVLTIGGRAVYALTL